MIKYDFKTYLIKNIKQKMIHNSISKLYTIFHLKCRNLFVSL